MRQVALVVVGFGIAFAAAYWIALPGSQPSQSTTDLVREVESSATVAAAPSQDRQGASVDGVVRDVLSRGFAGWEATSSQTRSLTALLAIIDLATESAERQSGAESLDSVFLAELLELWAAGNDSGALTQLSTIEQPAIRRAAAVLLVALRQFDARSFDAVLVSVPAAEQANLYAEVLTAQAADNPERALDAAASSETPLLRRLGMRRIAESLAYKNSEVVFDHASDIDDLALRSVYLTAAVTALAYQDPERAFSRLQSHQGQLAREDLFGLIARAYVRLDASAAWEWATELGSDYRAKVFGEIVVGNREYAAQLMRTELERDELDLEFLAAVLETSGSLLLETISSDEFSPLLARLTEFNGSTAESVIALVLSQWRVIDPVNAIQWAYSNPKSVPDSLIDDLAEQVALSDLAEASRVMDALPAEHQADWMSGVARAVAPRDFLGAMAWLASYESRPGYGDAVYGAFWVGVGEFAFVPEGLPEEVSPMLETYSISVRSRLLRDFTTGWSRQDPVKALDWVLQVEMTPDTEGSRRGAVYSGMLHFAAQDAAAAREWALELPPGRNRDAAIRGIVAHTGDHVLLEQIEDQAERIQAATLEASFLWSQGNREEAIVVLEAHISDEAERDRAYASIVTQPRIVPPGRILRPPGI